jgi:hypothetical protein
VVIAGPHGGHSAPLASLPRVSSQATESEGRTKGRSVEASGGSAKSQRHVSLRAITLSKSTSARDEAAARTRPRAGIVWGDCPESFAKGIVSSSFACTAWTSAHREPLARLLSCLASHRNGPLVGID